LTNMRVLPEPPRQGCSRWVRRELRYGTCALRLASAWNTSPSEDRLLLMLHASLARCPSAWLRASRSLQGHAAGGQGAQCAAGQAGEGGGQASVAEVSGGGGARPAPRPTCPPGPPG
jgi:hypothetical protein